MTPLRECGVCEFDGGGYLYNLGPLPSSSSVGKLRAPLRSYMLSSPSEGNWLADQAAPGPVYLGTVRPTRPFLMGEDFKAEEHTDK
jgi:hypothetical protein